ncbi:MAG TPA: hypothetical protein VK186_12985 [Candidatus Deferrimicrobium sp.]|nr:hypothetical protein [Candidatus Deferrimicrobium sp.]
MTIFRKQNGFKQFLALLVVFTLICPGVLSAKKEKHGAWLKVTKQDRRVVEGELLKVNENEILLMSNSETGKTIPINEIKRIKFEKKGKFLTGAVLGASVAMIISGIVASKYGGSFIEEAMGGGVVFGIPGGFVCGLISSAIVTHKTLNFENASPQQIFLNMAKLETLARF